VNLEKIRRFSPQLIKIAQKFGITRIYLFGSVARGDQTERIDVDFLVEMEAGASLFGVAGFSYESERLLGVPVDVIPLNILNTVKDRDFVQSIQKDAVLL